jgi:aminopeptidase N
MSEISGSSEWFRDRIVCRHFHGLQAKWTLREEPPKYAPDRTCDVEHLRLEIVPDLPGRRVQAVCTQKLRAAYGPFDTIVLDAVSLDIQSVQDGAGRDLDSTYFGTRLTVRFPEKVTDEIEIVIRYAVDHPALGLYFFGPSESEPEATWQLWSQGEDEEARHWIPCHDAPNEKMTTELIVSVDPQFSVISNGALLSLTESAGKRVFHFLESVPHVSYLITLVVGVFSRIVDEWKGIAVDYYVEPTREAEARRSFGNTPRMLEFFSTHLAHPYPYEKYTQVAIRHFHFGGMENTSATSQTDGTLHDDRASIDFSSDPLVAHELAHQWFGDLLTCKSWAHAWLNEGFATYFEALWKEADMGSSEFDQEMLLNAAAYMSEAYRRPIVTNRYAHPQDLFDAHLYPKGAWVLHMLRRDLGDELFWKAIRTYVRRHAEGVVETIDLIRAFEEATGRNMTGFFDQWVMSPGHPEIEGAAAWEEKDRWIRITCRQTQKPEGGIPAAFRIPLTVECRMVDGGMVRETFEMDRPEQTFYLVVSSMPQSLAIDPDLAVLATWKIARPFEWLSSALIGEAHDPRVGVRVDAVRQVAENASWHGEELLGRVLLDDPFWGVQAEAAKALAKIRSPHALELLIHGKDLTHPKARRAVMTALGSFRGASAAEALRSTLLKGDPSYFVEGAAASSLGKTRTPDIVRDLRTILARKSWHDVIALGAAEGLAATRDESTLEDILALASDKRRYWSCRLGALRAAAELGQTLPHLAPRISEELAQFLDDPEYLVRSRSSQAIVMLGVDAGVTALRRAASATPDVRLSQSYLLAADSLASQRRRGEDIDKLRDDIEKARTESKEMREMIRKLEEKCTTHEADTRHTPPVPTSNAPHRSQPPTKVEKRHLGNKKQSRKSGAGRGKRK